MHGDLEISDITYAFHQNSLEGITTFNTSHSWLHVQVSGVQYVIDSSTTTIHYIHRTNEGYEGEV